jgi:16S rRNA (guanine966-N2)-methyltransferase
MAQRIRIFGGSLQGTQLSSPRGTSTRPTTGLVREAIFNILGGSFEGAPVLDLFAGTGALGIEAVSRGASGALFVDSSGAACRAISKSLHTCGIDDLCSAMRAKLPAALGRIEGQFAAVFVDPPYEETSGPETLERCSAFVAEGGVLVYEHRSGYNPPKQPKGLKLTDRRTYGDTGIALYQPQENR